MKQPRAGLLGEIVCIPSVSRTNCETTGSGSLAIFETWTQPKYAMDSTPFAPNGQSSTPFLTNSNDLLVFELTKSGGRRYIHLNVRGLYRYVLKAITNRQQEQQGDGKVTSGSGEAGSPTKSSQQFPPPPPRTGGLEAIATTTTAAVTYRERLGGYLHPRDMRRLVTPFSATNEPELIVRRHVMLLNFDPLRAIITRDRLLVLVPSGADSILVQIEDRVRNGSHENSVFCWEEEKSVHPPGPPSEHERSTVTKVVSSLLHGAKRQNSRQQLHELLAQQSSSNSTEGTGTDGDNNDDEQEWNEMEGHEWIHLPFELQCAEAVLYVVSSILTTDVADLQQSAQDYVRRIVEFSLNDDPLTVLRVVKDAVNLMTNRVKGFSQSLNRILDEDEDMALMNLSRLLTHPERFIQPVSQAVLDEESDEPELILEASLQIALTLINSLDLLQGQINNAKELVDQKQDATRNRLLFANMMISVFSLCTSLASLVGSIFGMNIPNPYESDDSFVSFRQVTFGTVGSSIAMCFFIMMVLWYSGTIPRTTKSGILRL